MSTSRRNKYRTWTPQQTSAPLKTLRQPQQLSRRTIGVSYVSLWSHYGTYREKGDSRGHRRSHALQHGSHNSTISSSEVASSAQVQAASPQHTAAVTLQLPGNRKKPRMVRKTMTSPPSTRPHALHWISSPVRSLVCSCQSFRRVDVNAGF